MTDSVVQIEPLTCQKHQSPEVWKFILVSFFPLSTLPSFFWHLFFFIFLLRKTDRSRTSFKVNGKAVFSPARFAVHACHFSASSLALPFHFSRSLSLFFSLLHSFLLLSIYSIFFCQMVQLLNFHTILCTVYSLYVEFLFKMVSPDLVIATSGKQRWQWQEEGDEGTVSGSTKPLKSKWVSLCLLLGLVCPCCIKCRVM